MADYFKSALNYLTSSPLVKNENELLGNTLQVGSLSLRIKRVIAEGGYGVVYEAQDTAKGCSYALKRILSHDKHTADLILHEISLLKQLSGHPNIMEFVSAASVVKEKPRGTEYLIVTELCRGGQLSEYLPAPHHDRPLPANAIIQIMHQTCRAVQHMHNQNPPVIHRDLKIENLLLSENFVIKLCDFGSAGTVTYAPDASWTALKRGTVQEELEKFTTPMYRAPEMLDLYQNYPIGPPSDVWALGCILFYLTCTYHPFEESAKLAILNAKYNLPTGSSEHTIFHGLIRQMLLLDPRQRPTVTEILGELSELASMREIRVTGPIAYLAEMSKRHASSTPVTKPMPPTPAQVQGPVNGARSDALDPTTKPFPVRDRPPPTTTVKPKTPARPPQPPPTSSPSVAPIQSSVFVNAHTKPPSVDPMRGDAPPSSPHPPSTAGTGSGSMLGMLKGGAGHLLRNLRDASTKVMEQVSASLTTSDLDFQLITSRIAVMPYPSESGLESLGSTNSIEEVQAMLDSRYPDSYAVYNLSARTYRSDRWFDGRVSHRVFEPNRAPSLRSLIELCLNARLWLSQKPHNVCVVHCTDGRSSSAILVCSLLCFCRLFDNVSPALQLFASKRGNPHLSPSQIRYIDYVAQLAHGRISPPHQRPLKLIKLTIAPVPTFNKSKNGCRPFVEVYEGKARVFSTFTDYETLKSYVLEDSKIELLLNGVSVMGDLTVIIYHCRSSFAGRSKIASAKIAQFQLYTGFLEPEQSELIYFKNDLDCLDTSSGFGGFTSRYAESFNVTLEFMVSPKERPRQGNNLVYPWEMLPGPEALRPDLCVSSDEELQTLLADFGRFNISQTPSKRTAPARTKPKAPSGQPPVTEVLHDLVGDLHGGGSTAFNGTEQDADTLGHQRRGGEADSHQSNEASVNLAPGAQSHVEANFWSTDGLFDATKPRSREVNVEDSTPVADLLGFNLTDPSIATAPTTTIPDQSGINPIPSVLIDVDTGSTGVSNIAPNVSTLVDELFNVPAAGTTNTPEAAPVDENWAAAFDTRPAATPSSSKTTGPVQSSSSSNNPFDLFENSTPTTVVEDDFSVPQHPAYEVPKAPVPNTSAGMTDSLFADTAPFDTWWTNPGHMSSSASATNLNVNHASPLFASASCSNLSPEANSTKNTTAGMPADPFVDLSDVFTRSGQAAEHSKSRPTHGTSTSGGGFSAGPSPVHRTSTGCGSTNSSHPSGPSGLYTNSTHPHSSWSNFASSDPPGSGAPKPGTGARPHLGKDAFSDLLGDFGESSSWQPNADGQAKTVNQMRREQLAKTTDPDQLKVHDWAHGKSRNLRALLCSLPAILWDGVRWKPVSIADLITADQVKRQYRNAARAIHPDKWINTENEKLARMIFVELNDAMVEFEKDPNSAMSF